MNNNEVPAGGTPPTGKGIRNSDTILSASEQHNDSHHPPRDRKRSPLPWIAAIRIRRIADASLSDAVDAFTHADGCKRYAEFLDECGDYAGAEESRKTETMFRESGEKNLALSKHINVTFTDIVERVCQNTPFPATSVVPMPTAKNTEREARITITDLLREEAAQRGATAPPPGGNSVALSILTSVFGGEAAA